MKQILQLNWQADEVNHLISCQPTAIKAMRLQTLLPAYPKAIEVRDILGKDEVRFQFDFMFSW